MSAISPTNVVPKHIDAVKRAEAYIRTRQSPCGGFCFYRYGVIDEPNLGDTYYAVAALRLFGLKVPSARKVADFVSRARVFGLTYLYFSAFTLDQLGLGPQVGQETLAAIGSLQIKIPEAAQSTDGSGWLESTRKTIRLQQRFASDAAGERQTLARHLVPGVHSLGQESRYGQVAEFLVELMERGGHGVGANLWDTHLALSVGALLGLRPSEQTVAFVDSLQQPPIGFLMTARSAMPNLDVAYAGVRCCKILGLAVTRKEEVLDFTLACQSVNGGFAHAPDALPNLEFTYQGLKTLATLVPELTRCFAG